MTRKQKVRGFPKNGTYKLGPWSEKDREYIIDNAGKISPEEIAKNLGRSEKTVYNFMKAGGLLKYYKAKELEEDKFQNIRKSRYWPILQKQFTKEELENFDYHWQNITKQFREDILHTEELQILDVIKIEIMMDRILTQSKQITDLIQQKRLEIANEKKSGDPDKEKMIMLEREIASLYASTENITKEHTSLLKEKKTLMSSLKATREQRIQQIENSKSTLVGWVKSLYTNRKIATDIGIQMEKMRVAYKVEYQRLSEYYTYADGEVDIPLLNCDTVLEKE